MSLVADPRHRYDDAPQAADFTIDQQWDAYTSEEHDRWDRLFARSGEVLAHRACAPFLKAVKTLRLSSGGIPHIGRLSDRLEALTGWRVVAVRGLVPDEVFFDHLANRRFPAGAFLRSEAELDYIEEPDVFHDIFGHVPLLADPTYAAYLQAYGQAGARAMARGRLKNLARLYWYTVEFGLIEESGALRLFGAGIMSSTAESVFALEDPSPHRIRFDLERVMRTDYIIDDFQKVYFVIDSFEALLAACESDFGPLYDRMDGAEAIPPHRLQLDDAVLNRGTLAYFDKD